jgi:hypothetical protein
MYLREYKMKPERYKVLSRRYKVFLLGYKMKPARFTGNSFGFT